MVVVRMLMGIAGRDFSYAPGQRVDLDEDRARALISAGVAAPVRGESEKAVESEYETATMDAPRHVGGGWYELADGRRVRGREAAEQEAGGEDE